MWRSALRLTPSVIRGVKPDSSRNAVCRQVSASATLYEICLISGVSHNRGDLRLCVCWTILHSTLVHFLTMPASAGGRGHSSQSAFDGSLMQWHIWWSN